MQSPFKFEKYGQTRHRGQRALPRGRQRASTTSASSARCTRTSRTTSRRCCMMNCGDTQPIRPSMGSWLHVRPGHREPEPARLRRPVPRQAGRRPAAVEQQLPARHLPGHAHQQHERSTRRASSATSDNRHLPPRRPARAARPAAAQLNEMHLDERGRRRPARSPHRVAGDGLPHADRGAGSLRPDAGAAEGPRGCTASGEFADACLIARRLVERGVRDGAGLLRRRPAVGRPRRHHATTATTPSRATSRSPRCSTDLKARGLLDDTLVALGRRVRPHADVARGRRAATTTAAASRVWLAGGGVKGGMAYGATDEFGFARRREQGPRPRPARHHPAPDGPRPREAHLPLQRPRLPPDRRARRGGEGHFEVSRRVDGSMGPRYGAYVAECSRSSA